MSTTPRCDALSEATKIEKWNVIAHRWHNLAEELERELTAEKKISNTVVIEQTPLLTSEPESCATCRFFRGCTTLNFDYCARFPPVFVQPDGWRMPIMAPSEWCGEWRAKP